MISFSNEVENIMKGYPIVDRAQTEADNKKEYYAAKKKGK